MNSIAGGMDKHVKMTLFVLAAIFPQLNGDCQWYGQCGKNFYNNYRNCYYNGTGHEVTDPATLKSLKSLCPQYFNGSAPVLACCNMEQLKALFDQTGVVKLVVENCPACYRNLRSFICSISCDSTQSDYMVVTETALYTTSSGEKKHAVTHNALAVNYQYVENIIDSCKDVKFLGASALLTVCLSANCTPEQLMKTLTSEALGGPNKMTVYLTNEDTVTVNNTMLRPLQHHTYKCYESIVDEYELSAKCSCGDCLDTCPVYDFEDPQEEKVGKLQATHFIVIIFALVVAVGLLATFVYGLYTTKEFRQTTVEVEKKSKKHVGFLDAVSYKVESFLTKIFFRLGTVCAKHAYSTIAISLLICAALSLGMTQFEATTDPIELWGVINGRCLKEKEYFEKHFGPFYRIIQIFLIPQNQTFVEKSGSLYGPVYRQKCLVELLELQQAIEKLTVTYEDEIITLESICFAPLFPDNKNCTIQSATQYFQNSMEQIKSPDWLKHLMTCLDSPYHTDCLSSFAAPIFPAVSLGGYPGKAYENATAFVLTILLNNYLRGERLAKAKLWETEYINFMKTYKSSNFFISFSAERSIEDEVASESTADIGTVLTSYIVIFVYLSIFLGSFHSIKTLFVEVRLCVGLCCLLMIALSVTTSFGFFSYLGIKTSLIVLEVAPFLLLAVGSGDNFIFVKNFNYRFENSLDPVETKVARNLGEIGPSLLLSSLCQAVAFGIGATIPVGAVRTFALYSTVGVLTKFCLQVTFFVAVFTLDCKRQSANRVDVLCCIKMQPKNKYKRKNVIPKMIKKYYCPIILNKYSRPAIMLIFIAWFVACLVMITKVKIGLEQQITMPRGSYMIDYLTAFQTHGKTGPPTYLVVKEGYNYKTVKNQNALCGGAGCDDASLISTASLAANFPERSNIEIPPTSWIDDYFSWISSTACCQVYNNTNIFCPPANLNKSCVACPTDSGFYNQRPKPEDFNEYLKMFLEKNPDTECPKAGHAQFATAVEMKEDKSIGATNFMAYSAVQRSSKDFIDGLKFSRVLSDRISKHLVNVSGFPASELEKDIKPVFMYSITYVYYEQYMNISSQTLLTILYSILGVFAVTLILLGMDFHSAFIVLIALLMSMVNIYGLMYITQVDLNAVSVVNLVMAVGIVVEFFVHIVRDFSISYKVSRTERAADVISKIGTSIFIGVTIPEMISVATMSSAKSLLFQIYFFRMYCTLILMCTFNGLIFLPVLLSYCGPAVNKVKLKNLNEEISSIQSDEPNKGMKKQRDVVNEYNEVPL